MWHGCCDQEGCIDNRFLKTGVTEMLERIYLSVWVVYAVIFAAVFFSGSLTYGAATVFGFVAFGLIYMGMIGVLPFWTTHHAHPKH